MQGLIKALQKSLEEANARRQEAATAAAVEAKRREEEQAAKREETIRQEKDAARREAIAGLSPEHISKAEELANWEFIKDSQSAADFRDHLARFPKGVAERMARARLELIMFNALGEMPSLEDLDGFLAEFPNGRHYAKVKEQRDLLKAELDDCNKQMEKDWELASADDTVEAYETFFEAWPRSRHTRAARTRFRRLVEAGERTRGEQLAPIGEPPQAAQLRPESVRVVRLRAIRAAFLLLLFFLLFALGIFLVILMLNGTLKLA